MYNLVQTRDDVRVPNFDGEFPAAIETTRRQVNGPDDGAGAICVQQLGVELQTLQLMHFDSDIVQNSQAARSFNQFLFLQLVWWPRQNVYVYPPDAGPHQPLNNYGILIALILDPQSVLGIVNKLSEPLPPVADAPDEVGCFPRIERLPLPLGMKARGHFFHFVRMRGHNRVVPCF